jgi:hypothetical protein
MAEFKLGRIKFVWKGPWAANTVYYKDDVVLASGASYICINAHTAGEAFNLSLANWQQMSGGTQYVGDWQPTTYYYVGDLVSVNGNVYYNMVGHTSTSAWSNNTEWWALYSPGLEWRGNWAASTLYQVNDLVHYNTNVYLCQSIHTSTSTFDESKFQIFVQGLAFQDSWNSAETYTAGQVVTYGGYAYSAIATSVNQPPSTSSGYWALVTTGYSNQGTWNSSTTYIVGHVVQFGGWTYVATANSVNQQPYVGTSGINSGYWSLVVKGFNPRGTFSGSFATTGASGSGTTATLTFATQPSPPFAVGNNITVAGVTPSGYNGTYVVTACTTSSVSYASSTTGSQTVAGTVYGIYYPGDVVVNASSSYVATAVTNATPPNTAYWQLISQSGLGVSLISSGDIPYNSGGTVTALHMNSGTPTGTAAQDGYVLTATLQNDGSLQPRWQEYGNTANVWYVAPGGTNNISQGYGRTIDRPFASIKYACANVTGPATVFVLTGSYQEQLPIRVPANVTVIGDGLRVVSVSPASGTSDDGITPNNRSRMFILNDGSQVQSMSVTGLTGQNTVAPYISGDPLGILRLTAGTWPSTTASGAYFALDPAGSITSKSPYVQDVTCTGDHAVAAYVNGSDQTGGYKSILFNNFTSIIDGGIGLWIRNGGRTEAIDTHTYYAYIGMVAETGGVIRAQSNSINYGNFGAVATDLNPADTGYTGTISASSALTGNTITVTGLSQSPRVGNVIALSGQTTKYVVASITSYNAGTAVLVLTASLASATTIGATVTVYQQTSLIRLNGHDFVGVGAGNMASTAWPNVNPATYIPANQTISQNYGSVVSLTIDQDGNFSVGNSISVNQASGAVTINGLSNLQFGSGASINQFSTDGTLASNSNSIVPTQQAVKSYVGSQFANVAVSNNTISTTNGTGLDLILSPDQSGVGTWIAISGLTSPSSAFALVEVSGSTYTVTPQQAPVAASWTGVAYGNGAWASVAQNGSTAYTTNGTTWYSGTALPSAYTWWDVVYGNGTFLAVSQNTTSVISASPTLNSSTANWISVATNGTIWVAISASGQTSYSSNGITWNIGGTLPTATAWYAVTYGNGVFVAVSQKLSGGSVSAYSTNGITWTAGGSMGSTSQFYSLATNGTSQFVAVGLNTAIAAVSSNQGAGWTQYAMPSQQNWSSITYGSGVYVAVSGLTTVSTVGAYSTTGSNWTQVTLPTSAAWSSVTYGNGKFVAVASTGQVIYSTNGISWTASPTTTLSGVVVTGSAWLDVQFGNGVFLAIQQNAPAANSAAYSVDGITWTLTALSSNSTWTNAVYNPALSQWAVVAGPATLTGITATSNAITLLNISSTSVSAYSTNGISWSLGGSMGVSQGFFNIVAYGNGLFVAAAAGTSTVVVSANNGQTWAGYQLPSVQQWVETAYGSGTFVVVSGLTVSSNAAAYSTNGTTWTAATMPYAAKWTSVTYGNGRFVAISAAGNTAYSTNGSTWVDSTSTTLTAQAGTAGWDNVRFGNGLFFAVNGGAASSVSAATSPDGITWTLRTLPSMAVWCDSAYGSTAGGKIQLNQLTNYNYNYSQLVSQPYNSVANKDYVDQAGRETLQALYTDANGNLFWVNDIGSNGVTFDGSQYTDYALLNRSTNVLINNATGNLQIAY